MIRAVAISVSCEPVAPAPSDSADASFGAELAELLDPGTPLAELPPLALEGWELGADEHTPLEEAIYALLGELSSEPAPEDLDAPGCLADSIAAWDEGSRGQDDEEEDELRETAPLEAVDLTSTAGTCELASDLQVEPEASGEAPAAPEPPAADTPEPPSSRSHAHLVLDDAGERMVLTVAVRGSSVHVAMRGGTEDTAAVLVANADMLDHALQGQGLELADLDTQRERPSGDSPGHRTDDRQRSSGRRRHTKETP